MAISNAASKVRLQSKDDTSSRINMPMGIYLAIVKDNADDKGMGRLRVWIPEFKSDPSDSLSWTSVSYASPFAGASDPHATGSNPKSSTETQRAYGMWFVPPDVGARVMVIFAEGDVSQGFWIGSKTDTATRFGFRNGVLNSAVTTANDATVNANAVAIVAQCVMAKIGISRLHGAWWLEGHTRHVQWKPL